MEKFLIKTRQKWQSTVRVTAVWRSLLDSLLSPNVIWSVRNAVEIGNFHLSDLTKKINIEWMLIGINTSFVSLES